MEREEWSMQMDKLMKEIGSKENQLKEEGLCLKTWVCQYKETTIKIKIIKTKWQ